MQRFEIEEREGWPAIVESQGFPFHSFGKRPDAEGGICRGTYWYERAYYELSLNEVNVIEQATEELHRLCLRAVEHVSKRPHLLTRLGIDSRFHKMIQMSWERGDPALYGRFDLAYDGASPPKILEYNADTPTTLVETSIVQYFWLQDMFHKKGNATADQFNSIHEKLIERFRELAVKMPKNGNDTLYFSALQDNIEEFATVEYLRDLASQAGMKTEFLYLEDIGWNEQWNRYVDLNESPIHFWFKLYPYEWMVAEDFGNHLPKVSETTGILEPPWKMILSNKGILPILWELFPDHPNLLPAYWEYDSRLGDSFVEKPILGREGGNINLHSPSMSLAMPGPYAGVPKVFQKYAELPRFGEHYATIGSWVIGDKSAGVCIREDDKPIIVNTSRLVPHSFVN